MDQPTTLPRTPVAADTRITVVPWRAFTDCAGWDGLAATAAEPNPFAERWFVTPGLDAFDPHCRILLAAVHADGALIGIMPIERRTRYEQYPLPHLSGWTHPNAFCGAPLVAAGSEHRFWTALLGWADRHAGTALFFHLHHMPADGPLYAALRDVCVAEGRAGAVVHRFDRAMLASHLSPQDYFDTSLSAKKRKELRRQFNRLSDEGEVCFERRGDADGLDEWAEQFLVLEAAGWKGAEGSALACDAAKAGFFRGVLAGAARHGRLERLTISLAGAPIAMLANFVTAPGAYSFKTAYDERLARFSPGVLLQRENLDLLARDDIAWCDSCAAPDHPMIERIWREKRRIVRISLAIGGPLRRAAAAIILRAEAGADRQGL